MLRELLAKAPIAMPTDLLVGTETSDDAAVYRLNDTQAIVATTDCASPLPSWAPSTDFETPRSSIRSERTRPEAWALDPRL